VGACGCDDSVLLRRVDINSFTVGCTCFSVLKKLEFIYFIHNMGANAGAGSASAFDIRLEELDAPAEFKEG
jgi:hypothetical protein